MNGKHKNGEIITHTESLYLKIESKRKEIIQSRNYNIIQIAIKRTK